MSYEREKKLEKSRYCTDGYFTDTQWTSFLFQIKKVRENADLGEGDILEIGKGGGYVAAVLAEIGYKVTTFDINRNLNPSRVVDISNCPEDVFNEQYNCVLCAEVLEHIPFDKFEICIQNISRLSNGTVILTIPDSRIRKDFLLKIYLQRPRQIYFSWLTKKISPLPSMHCWQINSEKKCDYVAVKRIIEKYMSIVEEGYIKYNTYHHYYICKRNETRAIHREETL